MRVGGGVWVCRSVSVAGESSRKDSVAALGGDRIGHLVKLFRNYTLKVRHGVGLFLYGVIVLWPWYLVACISFDLSAMRSGKWLILRGSLRSDLSYLGG